MSRRAVAALIVVGSGIASVLLYVTWSCVLNTRDVSPLITIMPPFLVGAFAVYMLLRRE